MFHAAIISLLLQAPAPKTTQGPNIIVQGPEPAIVRLGDTSTVIVEVDGSTDCEVVAPAEVADLEIVVRPQGAQRLASFDGKKMISRVSTNFAVYLRPRKVGVFEIPFIPVRIGADTYQTRLIHVEAVKDIISSKLAFLEIVAPKKVYFTNEPIRLKVRFGIEQSTFRNVLQMFNGHIELPVQVEAPWLAEFPGGVALENEPSSRDDKGKKMVVNLTIVDAHPMGAEQRNGKTFNVFEFERAWLPGRFGEINLSVPMLRFQYATQFTQNAFGENVAADRQNAFVYGEALKLEIRPIPEDGRPPGYGGAVGQFKVSADATPHELKAGESLKFKFRIEGAGNIEFLEPPKLSALEGFHVYGRIDEKRRGERVVTYDLSPLSENVKEIPSVTFIYFDTTPPGAFKSVKTDPIAVTVHPLPPGSALAPLTDDAAKRAVPGVDDIFDMKPSSPGAGDAPEPPGPATGALALGAPILLAAGAWVYLRKRERDLSNPSRVRAREARSRFRSSLAASADPVDAFITYLADRLSCAEAAVVGNDLADRLQSRGIESDLARRAAEIVLQNLSSRYAGRSEASANAGGAARVDPEAFAQLADELERVFVEKDAAR